jgi:hypothetical protein
MHHQPVEEPQLESGLYSRSSSAPQSEACRWDFEVTIVSSLGEFPFEHRPSRGNRFAIVRLRLVNQGKIPISTSRRLWELTTNGHRLPAHVGTYDMSIDYEEREVHQGDDATTGLVFEVPSDSKEFGLEYVGIGAYVLERDKSLFQHKTN